MAQFHYDVTTDTMAQTVRNHCLYSSTDPYSLYASSARLSRYGVSNEAYTDYAHGISGLSSSLFGDHPWYQRSNFFQTKGQSHMSTGFPNETMTTDTSQQQHFGGTATSLTAFQMATDFTGLMDASDPVSCPKPVHPFYWRKRGNSVPTEGMTRTKDKYRVVYTEKQRIGLEKAFKDNKFITMKEKTVLSKELDLSERQVSCRFFISACLLFSCIFIFIPFCLFVCLFVLLFINLFIYHRHKFLYLVNHLFSGIFSLSEQ